MSSAQSRNGGGVDNDPAAAFDQLGNPVFTKQENSADINVQNTPPVILSTVDDIAHGNAEALRRRVADPGVVIQDVKPAADLLGGLQNGLYIRGLGHIPDGPHRFASGVFDGGNRSLDRLRVQVVNHDLRPF